MFSLTVVALLYVGLVKANTCRYEFNVPENSEMSCGSGNSKEMEYKMNRLENQLLIAHERTTSMHETLSKELTKLYTDAEALKSTTSQIEAQLIQMHTAAQSVMYLNEEVHSLKNMLMNTSDSMGSRFSDLQDKMIDVIEKLNQQSAPDLSKLQKQISDQESTIQAQISRIDQLTRDVETVKALDQQIENINTRSDQTAQDVTEIKESLNGLTVEPPLPDTVTRLNGTINLLQTMFLNGLRGDSVKIRNLAAELTNLKVLMASLKENTSP